LSKKSKEDYPKTTKDYQETYEKLQSQESNRLTISSFLGGLTFAAFVAFESSPIKISFSGSNTQSTLALLAAICLGISTLIFLAVAVSAYQAIRHLDRISQDTRKKLERSSNVDENIAEASALGSSSENQKAGKDLERVRLAWKIHEESEKAISLGFVFLILALIFVGLEVNYSVGIVVIVALLIVAYYFRTVRNMLTDWISAKVSRRQGKQDKEIQSPKVK
jgi:hypothetical protein